MKNGIAAIDFTFQRRYEEGGTAWTGTEKGTWKLDLARGRDLELEMKGTVLADGGKRGRGSFAQRRTVTYRP